MRKKAPNVTKAARAATSHQLAVRIDDELLQAIDREAERLRTERPGTLVHRSDIVRMLCWRALQDRQTDS